MNQNNRNFKVFEIEEEEPSFSAAEKDDLSSFDLAITEVLQEEGWLPQEEQPETVQTPVLEQSLLAENLPLSEDAEPVKDTSEDAAIEAEFIKPEPEIEFEQPEVLEEGPEAVPDIILQTPAVPGIDISTLSDKLADAMGLAPAADSVTEKKTEEAAVSGPETHLEVPPEASAEPEAVSVPMSQTEFQPEQSAYSGPIDDEFYQYFGNLKLTKTKIPEEIVFSSEKNIQEEHLEWEPASEAEASGEDKHRSALRNILSWALTIVVAFIAAMLINIYLFRPSEVSGPSMMPTLQNGDTVILSRAPYIIGEPQHGDIVVIDSNVHKDRNTLTLFSEALQYNVITKLMGHSEPDYFWIKRVIGVAGDTISFEANKVYRNGEELQESYINEQDVYTYRNGSSYTIEDGYVFVMGDNRNHSTDSRVIGPVPVDNIIGKMIADW